MYLESSRLVLRDFTSADTEDLQEIFGDSEVMRFIEPPYSREKTHTFIQTFCIERSPKGGYAVMHKETRKLIGYVLFKPLEDPSIYEIGWIFHRAYWRQGYAFEICQELIRYGFTEMGLHKISAETIDTERSIALMRKLGMIQEGRQHKHIQSQDGQWCDLYWYAILEEDFGKIFTR